MNYIGLIQQSIFQLPAVDIQISIDLCVCVLGCREEYDEDILVMSCRFVNCCLLRQSSFSLLSTPSNAMDSLHASTTTHYPFPSPFFLICTYYTNHCVSLPISFLSHMYVHLLLFIVCPFPSPSFLICVLITIHCAYDNNNRGYIGCIVVAPHYVILC